MESVNVENKQSQKVDRVVLDLESVEAIQKISDQVQKELGDLVQISQKDIVNFLIQERSSDLTAIEIAKIKTEHFDIVRALKRATQEAIKAKQDGHEIQMDELLKIIQTPSVSKNDGSKKPRGRRKKEGGEPAIHMEYCLDSAVSETSESAIKRSSKNPLLDSKNEDLHSDNKTLAT